VRLPIVVGLLTSSITARADNPTLESRIAPNHHWTIGVTLDRRITSRPFRGSESSLEQQSLLWDQLFGVSATYERRRWGINGRVVFLPQTLSPRTTIGATLGPRIRFRALGRDMSYGVNLQFDAVTGQHHWVLYASPAELSVDIVSRDSFRLQLVAGARYALTGNIIANVAIDPNGFPHEEFTRTIDEKLNHPLEGTITAVFARRID
jgi:opacity protein-like surface antigen